MNSAEPSSPVSGERSSISDRAQHLIRHAPHAAKIYTRRGDQGASIQIDGTKLSKSSAQITAIGLCDQAQSWLGVVIANLSCACHELKKPLHHIQRLFYQLQSDLAVPGCQLITHADTIALEKQIDAWTAIVPHIPAFILPGGSVTGANLQYARTVTRTAERAIVAFKDEQPDRVRPEDEQFINRLSDYLFTMARYANHLDHVPETLSNADDERTMGKHGQKIESLVQKEDE